MHDDRPAGTPDDRTKLIACLEIGKTLTSTLDPKEVLRAVMKTGSQIIPAENWSLLLRDPQTGDLSFEVIVGVAQERIKDIKMPRGAGIVGYVAETAHMVVIPDARSDPRFDSSVDRRSGFETRSLVCVPLVSRGGVLGVIEVVNVDNLERFQAHEVPFLQILADYAAIAIENARYVTRVEELTITDEYTGLRNARYLHRVLGDLLVEADSHGTRVSVAFADLDNFKDIVDAHGHLTGSEVLREVGQRMNAALDPTDILVKYGGDEFVVLMPGKATPAGRATVERVREAVSEAPFLPDTEHPVGVTASFGVATFPDHAKNPKDLLLRADGAMSKAKRAKNTVVAA